MNSQNVKISWKSYGDPYFPTVILIPGLGMPASLWPMSLIEGLVRQGLRVVTVENRSGATVTPITEEKLDSPAWSVFRYFFGGRVKAPFMLEDMANDVETVMDELNADRAHIVGVSLGGMIAQVLACQSPQRVITLTCISSATGNPRRGLGSLRAVMSLLKNSVSGKTVADKKKAVRALVRVIGSTDERYDEAKIEGISEKLQKANIDPLGGQRQLLAILASGDRRKQLRQLTVPTLVIHGIADRLLSLEAGREIAATVPHATIREIAGMAHDLPERHINEIVEAIGSHCYRGSPR